MSVSAPEMIKTAMQVHQSGDWQRAKSLYNQVLKHWPDHPDALHLYGLACHQLGDHSTAVSYILKAVQQVPEQPVLRNNLADAMHKAGQLDEAVLQLQKALQLSPDYTGAHQNLGSVYLTTRQYDLALLHCRRAVVLDDQRPEAWHNLGLCFLEHVRLDESANAFRHALALRPDYQAAVTSLLYLLNLLPDQNPEAIAKEHLQVAGKAFGCADVGAVAKLTHKPIRVGYVSGDFRQHAVNNFFEPVLEHHNKGHFEIYCYSDVRQPDATTQRLQKLATHWRDMSGHSHEELLKQVHTDGIDILVDLAGHTRHNRMPVFARQAAKVQLSWLGFPNTSGLQAMNYRIVDSTTEPANLPAYGSEHLIRMPAGFACFRAPENSGEVSSAPLSRNGFVTLGSLHKLEKLNPSIIALWSQLLNENPDTRLLIARDNLDAWQQRRLLTEFEKNGTPAERLQLRHLKDPEQNFWKLFAEIDLFLDVFPWSGHTMACCALWMGVPVVSMYGKAHAGRMVSSVLDLLKLNELIATDRKSYSRIVSQLCSDPQQLADYRRGLRSRFENSPLRDEAGFTRELERQYLNILNI
jgi:predicted O-linked N-acetylglucosamine transferase (SPINDLY family)